MPALIQQRCFHHAEREAVARCPECLRFFCRECVTEHEDRVVCAACLRAQSRKPILRAAALGGLMRLAQAALGVVVAWFFFFLVGEALQQLPNSFHDGTLWRVNWYDSP